MSIRIAVPISHIDIGTILNEQMKNGKIAFGRSEVKPVALFVVAVDINALV